ncbi:MAG TPA: GIY-YIG nuclease family protein [Anaerovoracaceae bacterium]|nr:GIY-YIG nuclease family protein [Anaerovoracaceae bacterium]
MTEEKAKTNYIYIIQCADGTLYTGWTTDLESRMEAHNSGAGAKYTRGRGPVRLLYSEAFETKGEALKREIEIKKLKRGRKLKLMGLGGERRWP